MDIFLPYEDNIFKSIASLDDNRLKQQIDDCEMLLKVDESYTHPLYENYKNNIDFIAYYGLLACREYSYRFRKHHTYEQFFTDIFQANSIFEVTPVFIPKFFDETTSSITSKNVSKQYQELLNRLWHNDVANNQKVTWTKRSKPAFIIKEKNQNEKKTNK